MGRKLAAALVLLAASRLPFIQHEGKRVAVADMRSLHFQSSVAAILSRLKLELLRQRFNHTSLETTNAYWGAARNLQTIGTSAESISELPAADENSREESGESTAASKGLTQNEEDRAGPDWLQRLGFSASEGEKDKDEELADIILRHLGRKEKEKPEPQTTTDKEGSSKEDGLDENTTSELFAIDSDGDGRLEPALESGEGEKQSEGGKLDLVKEGYASLKEKVGLQIFQDIADPVIGLYKRAIAKGSELEAVANLRMLADIASSMQATTAGMDPWSLSDLTLGLYLLSLKHAAEGVQDTIPGEMVKDRGEVEDLLYHLELARGAYAQDAAGLARVCMLRECRVAKFEAKATLLRPAYYIAADDRRKLIVLGIRGTTQAHDLFTDLATAGEEFLDGGFAHAGILHAAKWFVKNEAPMLKEQLQQNPGYSLRLVGHSLGGGTAAVTTILLRDQPGLVGSPPEKISAVCFSPPACLSRSLANRTSAFAKTLVMQDDAIPRASARAMDRLRREVENTDWNMVGPGESLASLKGVASRHLESLQPTLQKLQAVAMDYAPAVLASRLKLEPPAAEEAQRGTGNRESVSAERSEQVGEAESREETTGAEDRRVGKGGRAGKSVWPEGAGERSIGNRDNEAASKGSGDPDAPRQGCSGKSGQAGRETDERGANGEAEEASGTGRSERNPFEGPDEELFAPGRLYHLVYKEKNSSEDSQDGESEPSPRVYRMICGTETARFSRIVLSKSMLVDHAGREVYWGLRELLKIMP